MGTIAVGIDLGQKVDPSAIIVTDFDEFDERYAVRFLHRFPLGTGYDAVAKRVGEICRTLLEREARAEAMRQLMPLGDEMYRAASQNIWVVADATGVGVPVIEMIVVALEGTYIRVAPIFFTHGDRTTIAKWGSGREASLGKGYLVGRLQALIQTQRIALPDNEEAKAMVDELKNYEIRVDENANDKYGAFKVGKHDDLVTALGLSCIMDRKPQRKAQSYDGTTGAGYRPPQQVDRNQWLRR